MLSALFPALKATTKIISTSGAIVSGIAGIAMGAYQLKSIQENEDKKKESFSTCARSVLNRYFD